MHKTRLAVVGFDIIRLAVAGGIHYRCSYRVQTSSPNEYIESAYRIYVHPRSRARHVINLCRFATRLQRGLARAKTGSLFLR